MDIERAKEILRILADGTDPLTGGGSFRRQCLQQGRGRPSALLRLE